jgi:hypothetical protein
MGFARLGTRTGPLGTIWHTINVPINRPSSLPFPRRPRQRRSAAPARDAESADEASVVAM